MESVSQMAAAASAAQAFFDSVQRAAAWIVEVLSQFGNAVSKVANAISENLYAFAEAQYLKRHRRCPGGRCATARLAKKRRTKVLAWFMMRMKRLASEATCR